MDLSESERILLRKVFPDRPEKACEDCGGYHLRTCPRIKREVKLGNGNRTEIEYWPRAEWEDVDYIVWPEDVWDEEPNE